MSKLKFYSDPSHGWLAVKRSAVESLGLLDTISSFSYQKGQTVYLEEDRDATLFLQALKANGQEYELEQVSHDESSWIRNLERFTK
jgi:hypothetical protein